MPLTAVVLTSTQDQAPPGTDASFIGIWTAGFVLATTAVIALVLVLVRRRSRGD